MRPRAFTLIELLVVVSIIGVLITLVVVAVRPIQIKSRDATRKSNLNLYLTGLDLFKADFKVYPNHTFYLGKNTTDLGAVTSSFDLGTDIAGCQGLNGAGNPTNFSVSPADFTTAETNYNLAVLKPGLAATNHFLLCLKYIDRLIADPTRGTGAAGYHYRVSYDYVDSLVSAELENVNDSEAKLLFNSGAAKRYHLGTGMTVRHLDEDSNAYNPLDLITREFYSALATGTLSDGIYLYQCKRRDSSTVINRDDRSLSANEPLTYQSTAWKKNPGCWDNIGGLDAIRAY